LEGTREWQAAKGGALMREEMKVYASISSKPQDRSCEESLEPFLLEGFVASSGVCGTHAVCIREEFLG
jgi:hypothetical protein